MATKTFSGVKGGYRSNGTSITLVSNKVLSSTNPVRINSITVTCGVGNAYGMMPYVSDTTTGKSTYIGSYVKSNGSTVNMLPDGGYFFYPSSSTTISSSNLTKYTYENDEYYRLSGYAGNFVYADGASTTIYASVGGKNSSSTTVSNTVYAKYVKCGTVGGDSTKPVYGVTVGSGAASKTISFNPDTSEISAGEAIDVKLYCTGNGLLCVPSGSTVTINYTEVTIDNPSSGQATGTVTFVAPGSYSTSTTTISASTFSNYYNWEYVNFPASVPTISGSHANYMSYGYKYPSLQNIVSATMSSPTYGGVNNCIYNGELYYNCEGPDDTRDIAVTYRTGDGAFPGSITVLETGLYAHTITLNSPSTSYSLSSAASPEFIAGYNALVFPEISGWQLQVVPDNSPYSSIEKYATYTKIQSGSITVSGLSNNYNITYQTMGTKTENVYAVDDDYNYIYSDWNYVSFDYDVRTVSGSCNSYMSNGYEVPTTLLTISNATLTDPWGSMSCCIYNGKAYVYDDGPPGESTYVTLTGTAPTTQTITRNGTYTFSSTISNLTATDKTFNETGEIEYLDNGNITIEFRKDRRVDVFLVQQYESYMREPFVPTILTINFSNGQSQSITLNYNRNGPDMEATGVATHTYTNATVTSYYVFGKTYTTGITNGNDASISNVVELIDLGPWRQVIPYVYINGQWVKYEDTRLYNNGWKKATWRIYST